MSTVQQVMDRTRREWLEPPSRRPAETTLSGDISAAALSITYTDGILSVDQENAIASGTILEVGRELMMVTNVDNIGSQTLAVTRQYAGGSDAEAHSTGDTVRFFAEGTNRWFNQQLFNAVCDAVEGLWPPLYRVATVELTMGSSPREVVDEDALDAIEYRYWDGLEYARWDAEILNPYPKVTSGRGIQWTQPVPIDGAEGYLVYKASWSRPTSPSTDLGDDGLEIPVRYDEILAVDAAASMLAGVDLESINQEYITRQLEAQSFPVQSGQRIRDGLLNYYQFRVGKEMDRLDSLAGVQSQRNKTVYRMVGR